MNDAAYFNAIAGLLHDPLLSQAREWIPRGWEKGSKEVVKLASQLAAGVANGEASPGTSQLRSILNSITADKLQAPASAYWPVTELNLKEIRPFPQETQTKPDFTVHLRSLDEKAKELNAAFEGAQSASLPQYIESLMLLLQRYAWCLPSGYANAVPI